jgi:aromatase
MTELRIWTARHTIRVAAPPRRVFELVANIDRWPALSTTLEAVEHLGFDGVCERTRFWTRIDGVPHGWTSVRELNPKRLQVRFRHVDFPSPLASMGGLWLVVPKGVGSVIALDHYFRVTDNQPATAARLERDIGVNSMSMLAALKQTAELDGMADLVESYSVTEGNSLS